MRADDLFILVIRREVIALTVTILVTRNDGHRIFIRKSQGELSCPWWYEMCRVRNMGHRKDSAVVSTITYFLRSISSETSFAHDIGDQARIQGGGGALGPAPTPGTEGPAPKARVPSSQGQKEETLVSLEWLFDTIQA